MRTRPRWNYIYAEAIAVAMSYPPKSPGRDIWVNISYALINLSREEETK